MIETPCRKRAAVFRNEAGYEEGMRFVAFSIGLAAAVMAGSCGSDTQTNPVASAGSAGLGGTNGGTAGASGAAAAGTAGVSGRSGAGGSGGNNSAGSLGSAGSPEGSEAGASGSGDGAGAGGTASEGGGGQGNAGAAASGASGSAGASGNCGAVSADKRIFVSSALYTGDLGGLDGADSKCQLLAKNAGLCGTFKAWLSDGTGNAADRLSHATGNYLLLNDQVVASDWSALTSGTLQHAIDMTEEKGPAPAGTVQCGGTPLVPVWTGATASGIAVTNGSCSNWGTNGTGPGAAFGNAAAKSAGWSGTCQLTTVCADTAALYCLEQ